MRPHHSAGARIEVCGTDPMIMSVITIPCTGVWIGSERNKKDLKERYPVLCHLEEGGISFLQIRDHKNIHIGITQNTKGKEEKGEKE